MSQAIPLRSTVERMDIMNTCEYQCMECKMEFSINLMDKELDQKPKISCPHCGAEHVHNIDAKCNS